MLCSAGTLPPEVQPGPFFQSIVTLLLHFSLPVVPSGWSAQPPCHLLYSSIGLTLDCDLMVFHFCAILLFSLGKGYTGGPFWGQITSVKNCKTFFPQLGMPLGWLRGSYCIPSISVVCAGLRTPRVPSGNRVLLKRLLHLSREFVICEIGILSRVPGLSAGFLGPPELGVWAQNPPPKTSQHSELSTNVKQSKAKQSKAMQCTYAKQGETNQCYATQSNAKQCKAMQSKAKQSKAIQSNATKRNAMQSKAMQSNAKQSNAKQCKAMHSNAKQCKANQCRAM